MKFITLGFGASAGLVLTLGFNIGAAPPVYDSTPPLFVTSDADPQRIGVGAANAPAARLGTSGAEAEPSRIGAASSMTQPGALGSIRRRR